MTLFFFFQNALESLKQRAELVITENETLFDQLKTQAITQVLSAEKQTDFEVCLCANWFVHCSHTAIFKLIINIRYMNYVVKFFDVIILCTN